MHEGINGSHPKRPLPLRWNALSRQRQIAALTCCLVVIGAIVIGIVIWFSKSRTIWPDKTLAIAAQSASYPVYYPATLPNGFSYKAGSATYSANVFIYILSFNGTNKLFISAVPKPANVQFNDFYNRILSNKVDVLSTQGKAVIGNADGQTIGSLVTNKSWVTLNTKSSIDSTTLKNILSSLKPLP